MTDLQKRQYHQDVSRLALIKTDAKSCKRTHIGRRAFWGYCQRAAAAAKARAIAKRFPCEIDAHYLDQLLVDQEFRCAVSGVLLTLPIGPPQPFGPSIDRIEPALGYVPGNVRIVCSIANFAMHRWGEAALKDFLLSYAKRSK